MSKTRRMYTREYKAEAVRLLTQQGISAGEAGRRLGIGSNLISRWKNEIEAEGDHAFPGNGNRPPVEEELRRLRAGNKRLVMERDILKKSASIAGQRGSVVFPWIFKNQSHWPVRVMCQVLKVSTSGFYKWCRRPPRTK